MKKALIVCAFPGSGKTTMVHDRGGFDLDRGKLRNMFGVSFEEEGSSVANLVDQLEARMIGAAGDLTSVIFINDHKLKLNPKKYEIIYFFPRATSAKRWLQRIENRGDDISAPWCVYISENFERCISEWKQYALKNRAHVIQSDGFLSHNEYLVNKIDEYLNTEEDDPCVGCAGGKCPSEECPYSPDYDY